VCVYIQSSAETTRLERSARSPLLVAYTGRAYVSKGLTILDVGQEAKDLEEEVDDAAGEGGREEDER